MTAKRWPVQVLVDAERWRRLQQAARPSLKALLLSASPTAELEIPTRRRFRRRKPAESAG